MIKERHSTLQRFGRSVIREQKTAPPSSYFYSRTAAIPESFSQQINTQLITWVKLQFRIKRQRPSSIIFEKN